MVDQVTAARECHANSPPLGVSIARGIGWFAFERGAQKMTGNPFDGEGEADMAAAWAEGWQAHHDRYWTEHRAEHGHEATPAAVTHDHITRTEADKNGKS